MRRVKMIVSGRVQGVGYRYYVQDQAKQHGIKGYVRNLPGSEVEIDAEGERSSLGIFITDCKKGPRFSDIIDCMIQEITPYGFDQFSIKH